MNTTLRAILFEDSETVASALKKILVELGYDCCCIGDLGRAVPQANIGEYDIAVVDLNFCNESAYRLLDILKFRHIDILIVEGNSRCPVRSPYDQEVTIRKPLNIDSFRAAIELVAKLRRAEVAQ
jgi:DNA-binding response OmpR family regulator